MRPIRVVLVGAGVILAAGTGFVFGDGLLRASAFMVGIATLPIVLGVLLDRFIEDRSDRLRGQIWRLASRFQKRRSDVGQRARCSLCRKLLESSSGGVRICPECDVAEITA